MVDRLVLSELRVLIEHFTTSKKVDPEFMRAHASALASAIEAWANELEQDRSFASASATIDEGQNRPMSQ